MIPDFEKDIADLEAKIAELLQAAVTPEPPPPAEGQPAPAPKPPEPNPEVEKLKQKLEEVKKEVYSNLTPWQTVQVARHPQRPLLRDYIGGIFSDFIELHGDRCFGDDRGIIGGFAKIDRYQVMLIGHQKGKTVEDNVRTNFGMANPEGYRKALRLMKLAEKYHLPVVSFIDTPGAYPGADAEARGQAEAIARNLTAMSELRVPIVVVVTGEGGSGGALGIAVGDVILMLSNAVYSVISPEGCASILWRDGSKAPEAAAALCLTAGSLRELGVVDEIIPEPPGGAHRDPEGTMGAVKVQVVKHLKHLKGSAPRKLMERRFEKFARMGRHRR
jgi:acetyl-CoA carboxylase carboxyl transferase subunit alpha